MRKKFKNSIDRIKLNDEDKNTILNNVLNHEAKVINLKLVYSSIAVCFLFVLFISYDGANNNYDESSLLRTMSNNNIMYENQCFIQTNDVVDLKEYVDSVVVDELNLIKKEIYIDSNKQLCILDNEVCYVLKECEGEGL